jgi:hypothetical protein
MDYDFEAERRSRSKRPSRKARRAHCDADEEDNS